MVSNNYSYNNDNNPLSVHSYMTSSIPIKYE